MSVPLLDVSTQALDAAYEALRQLGHTDLAERVMAVRIELMERYPAYPQGMDDQED